MRNSKVHAAALRYEFFLKQDDAGLRMLQRLFVLSKLTEKMWHLAVSLKFR